MKKLFLILLISSPLTPMAQIKYPDTKKISVTDDYHGTKVEDPYRWLEDDNAEATKNWVKEENKVTLEYLATIPIRDRVRARLEKLWDYPRFSSPFKKSGYFYFFKNDGLQNQPVLYRQRGINDDPEEFLNPNTLNKEGIAALGGFNFSKSGKYFSYSIAVAGSDWQEVYVMETATKKLLPDTVRWVKFSSFSWNGDDGFYYSGYDKPNEETKLSKQNQFHKVFYHKLGTAQSQDKLVYEDKKHPLRYHSASLTEDLRFLIVYVAEGTSGSEIWFRDLKDPAQKTFKQLIPGFATDAEVVDNDGGRLLVRTNDDAPNFKLVSIDPKKPEKKNWQEIIPEKAEALQAVSTGGGFLFADYLKDASTRVYQHAYDGKFVREIMLPGIGSASGFGSERADKDFFYSYSSFATPPAIYRYDIATGKSTLFRETKVNMQTSDFITEQVFFNTDKQTKVPVFLTYKKGLKKDGKNPVLLYGYGGFNVAVTPAFSVSNAFFIEQGGIYAVVTLRGGSEYGEKWHKAGMLDKKQNVFNDFINAAEYLISAGYTSPSKIAIRGGSNGGLLVGAVMTQRPELFKVALPAVGVMDMLRFHKFTVGWGWVTEYGSADSVNQFPYLYKYSPYHNLKPGVKYPATLVTTADHDDRVVPAHSFKFAARLQEYNKGSNPVLIRIDTDAGHGAGKPTSKAIDEAADTWSFVMHNLGMPFIDASRVSDAGNGKSTGGKTLTQQKQDKAAAAGQQVPPSMPSTKSANGQSPGASSAPADPKHNPFTESERAKRQAGSKQKKDQ
ncbi:MAG: S9 family peptidase [Citrobacter freundii]|nr:MAG: S9 family peptidase [Citrobacter freundii]